MQLPDIDLDQVEDLEMGDIDLPEMDGLNVARVLLESMTSVSANGISRDVVTGMQSLVPGLLSDYPIMGFTEQPSTINLVPGMQAFLANVAGLIWKAIKAIWNIQLAVLKWIWKTITAGFSGKSRDAARRVKAAVEDVKSGKKVFDIEEYYSKGTRLSEFIEDEHKSLIDLNDAYRTWGIYAAMNVALGEELKSTDREIKSLSEKTVAKSVNAFVDRFKDAAGKVVKEHSMSKELDHFYPELDNAYDRYELIAKKEFVGTSSSSDNPGPENGDVFSSNSATWRATRIIKTRREVALGLHKSKRRSTTGARPNKDAIIEILESDFFTKAVDRSITKTIGASVQATGAFLKMNPSTPSTASYNDNGTAAAVKELTDAMNSVTKAYNVMSGNSKALFDTARLLNNARTKMNIAFHTACKAPA